MENNPNSNSDSKKVVIYTDGACSGNPGPGGWGAILMYGSHAKKLNGGDIKTTNNRMELTAVIEALKALKRSCSIDLYTDSSYVKDGITKWIHGWKKNGWRKGGKKKEAIKNLELWQELDKQVASHKIEWHWVKGHSGDVYNEIADELARGGIDIVKEAEKSKNS